MLTICREQERAVTIAKCILHDELLSCSIKKRKRASTLAMLIVPARVLDFSVPTERAEDGLSFLEHERWRASSFDQHLECVACNQDETFFPS
jgi:hypothetical protein